MCALSALIAAIMLAGGGVGSQPTPGEPTPGPYLSEPTPEPSLNEPAPEPCQNAYTAETRIADVMADPVFGDFGQLIFPVNDGYWSGDTLGDLRLTWYNNIDPAKTVEITNYMKDHAESGETIFYDIYTDEEKAADPAKADTGLFFFRGEPGERFAICNAGGGFSYVGAMHDSFPHALELSKMGYNAFALIYRPGAQTACEDLARAITFIFEHADELQVNTDRYSLWGGSAGARMAAYLGSHGPAAFGGADLPQPGAVIMQYTGHSEYAETDPPTYACVGTNDGIANWQSMENRLQAMEQLGIPTEFHAYEGLSHGFGLGTGTVAEGWIYDAASFWADQFLTHGTNTQRGFVQDNVLHSALEGDIHFSSFVPNTYDGSEPYALFITLPGYEGLYFQGVGANMAEDFGPESIKYNDKMIVLSPQLDDWGETSANKTIALTEYFLRQYNIDPARVYLHGMSGGGETGSLVMGKRPELFAAYLMTSSKWDGSLEPVADARTPVYLAIGEEDSYYGSGPLKDTYARLHDLYAQRGLREEQIRELLVLDVRPQSFFSERGFQDQHAGGQAFAHEEDVMQWIFSKAKREGSANGGESANGEEPLSGIIPAELEYVPAGYQLPAEQQGTLEKLEYQTWESLSYDDHVQRLTKTAWAYVPYGYTPDKQYNILYLSHGGWSNETTLMGTPEDPHAFKHIMDHAIQDGRIQPLLIVLPTYNNTSASDSGNYSLALQLTSNFHNELVNDLIPAAESRYSTYATSTDAAGLAASRDHRAFGGFSMGSMNTWHTFANCLDYFRYFAPASGGPLGDGERMASYVRTSGHDPSDFFIFAASGTDDFAYSGFKHGVLTMADTDIFTLADNEQDGNLAFREREGFSHDANAANEYMYNALRFFWSGK